MEVEKTSLLTPVIDFFTLKKSDYLLSFLITLTTVIIISVSYHQKKDDKNIRKAYKDYLISRISIATIMYVGLLLIFTMYPGTYTYLSNLSEYIYTPYPFSIITVLVVIILNIVGMSLFV